jgi:hypothetical protein
VTATAVRPPATLALPSQTLGAFTFPLGAYTIALQFARSWPTHQLEWIAALFPLLVGFWLTDSMITLRAIRTGQAWQR